VPRARQEDDENVRCHVGMTCPRLGGSQHVSREPSLLPFVRFALDMISTMPPRERPWGVWFARHAPVTAAWLTHLSTPVTDVWFWTGQTVRRRSIWTFARFVIVHEVQGS
jgi:hypothetical protein